MKKLEDLLKGCRLQKDANGIIVQTIRNMQLVCLTTDDEFSVNRFANPLTVLGSNKAYGHLHLRNPDAHKDMIVPAQIAVITKLQAQNHGMVKAGFIKAGSFTDFNDAGCVQGSQAGAIREDANSQDIRFIPFGAREFIWDKANNNGHLDNIYAAIEKVGRDTGANSGKYLDQYFTKFDKEINEFIAHFERPARTIGTIVLIDGEIVAIDKFPSFEYCEQIWDCLIRDCYGAIAITEENKGKKGAKLFTEMLSKTVRENGESDIAFLQRTLSKTKHSISSNVKERLEDAMELEFSETRDADGSGYKSTILKTEGYIGQVISESSFYHLVSIVKKESFNPERFRAASEIRNKAKKQSKFEL
jgi:hypothetical protein